MRPCLMLLCLGFLASLAAADDQDRQQRHERAVAAIRKLGGEVKGGKKPGESVAVVLTGTDDPAACLPHLADLDNLGTCDL
jgi:hypothetical protein